MVFLLLLPTLVFYTIFTVWPIIKVIQLSFYETNFITSNFVGLQNYINLLTDQTFLQTMKNSVWYVVFMVLGQLFMSTTVALAVSKLNKKWQDISRILLYIPVLGAGIITAQVWRWIFSIDGLANWLLSLVGLQKLNWFSSTFPAIPTVVFIAVISSFGSNVIILLASILSIDTSIFEAAKMDGAHNRQIQWYITLPMIKSTIIMIALLSMINAMQIFETIYALAPYEYAATPTYSIYVQAFKNSHWGLASAQGVLLLIFTVILSLFKRRVEEK